MLCIYIHTLVIFQPADFGQRMSRASNSVVYARALWRSIRDSKSLGEGPDRSSIAVPTAIEKACCSYAHTWIAILIYVFYLRWMIIYIYFYRYLDTSLASSNQQISTDTTGDWESPPLCPLRWWHTFGHLRSLGQVLGLPYYAFYLLPARFWELAAGVILYLFCAKVMTGEWLTERICSTVVHCTGRDNEEYIYICFVTSWWLQFFNHILFSWDVRVVRVVVATQTTGITGWSLEVLRRNASFPRCWCDSLQYSLCSSCGLPCFSCDLLEKWKNDPSPWAHDGRSGLKIDCPHDSLPTMLFPQFQT